VIFHGFDVIITRIHQRRRAMLEQSLQNLIPTYQIQIALPGPNSISLPHDQGKTRFHFIEDTGHPPNGTLAEAAPTLGHPSPTSKANLYRHPSVEVQGFG
jgi:hypothetical protein